MDLRVAGRRKSGANTLIKLSYHFFARWAMEGEAPPEASGLWRRPMAAKRAAVQRGMGQGNCAKDLRQETFLSVFENLLLYYGKTVLEQIDVL